MSQLRYFTPGPSQLHPIVADGIQAALSAGISSISHRSPAFVAMYTRTETALRLLLNVPADYSLFFMASANEIWERIAQNCINQASFHLVNGDFSNRFYEFVQLCEKKATQQVLPFGQGFRAADVLVPPEADLIAACANETSSGVWTSPETIYALAEQHPDKLVVVDVVSAYPTYQLDLNRVDAAYFSVQKGFGLPAGLGVLICSPRMLDRALEMEKRGLPVGSYHRFSNLKKYADRKQTPETPNALGIYLLGRVAEAMRAQGDELLHQHHAKAKRLYDFFADFPGLRPFIQKDEFRSETAIVLESKAPAQEWVAKLKTAGFVIGAGYGSYKTKQLRIANFPATSLADVEELLAAFQACV